VRVVRSGLFPGLDNLVGLIHHGVDAKPTLLRVLTDLYVQKPIHSRDEECQYTELALRLIDDVDAETRAAVARRLANYPKAPREIVNRLSAKFPPAGQAEPVGRTVAKPDVAPPICPGKDKARVDKTKADAAFLTDRFFAADGPYRLYLLAALDAQGPLNTLDVPAPAADVSQQLEASALAGRPSEFIRALECALGVTRTMAETIVNDPSGEPLLIAAKALSIPIEGVQRILLFVSPSVGHSVRRVYALTALYDKISFAGALRLVAAWRLVAPGDKRASLPTPAARPSHTGTSATSRGAASGPARSSENFVTRNREFGEPRQSLHASSPDHAIKKMTP
jgi:hypothetical protein